MDNGTISIYNTIGQRILNKSINHSITEINTSDFKSGIYYVVFSNKEHNSTKKLIIE